MVDVIDIGALWNFGDPAASAEAFRRAMASATATGERAELLSQIARAEGLQGRFDEGHALLDEAALLLEGEPELRAHVRIALERGRLRNSSGDPAAAVPHFDKAFAISERTGDVNLGIDALHMLGIAAPPDERLAWNERALAAAERATDPAARRWQGPLLNNIGWTYHDQGEFETALRYFERSVIFRRDAGQEAETRIAEWSVARALRSLGRFEDARAMQERLLAENAAAGSPDPYVFEELGEILLALGRADEATPFFGRAYEGLAADSWFVANEAARLARLKELGGV